MKFTVDNVDIPDDLLSSLRQDKLVVFVGAGVSNKAYSRQPITSYYPLFRPLARQIIESQDSLLTEVEEELLKQSPDRVLGDREHTGMDVRSVAAGILTANEDMQRIDLHRAIVQLFHADLTPRLVTTNFDRMLVQAIDAECRSDSDRKRWLIHKSPALPPGSRFSGVCFLHGIVDEPREMVLTDKDIGRAYMDEGWALTMVKRLFRTYDVLFIGYSLEDPPLRYLSLALEGNSDRSYWALVAHPKTEAATKVESLNWERRGVTPIWFPVIRNDYRSLERTIHAWGRSNRQTFTDSRNLLEDAGKNSPAELEPYSLDRIRFLLTDRDLVRDFARSVPNPDWFEELVDSGRFESLFTLDANLDTSEVELATTLVTWLLDEPDIWVGKLAAYRYKFNDHLCFEFLRQLEGMGEGNVSDETVAKCVELFRPTLLKLPKNSHGLGLETLINRLVNARRVHTAIEIFSNFVSPEARLSSDKNLSRLMLEEAGEDVSELPEVVVTADLSAHHDLVEYTGRELLTKCFLGRSLSVLLSLFEVLEQELIITVERSAWHRDQWVRAGDWRPAIEPHDSNRDSADPLNFYIDALRDIWENIRAENSATAEAIASKWCDSKQPILERLGLYGLRVLLEDAL